MPTMSGIPGMPMIPGSGYEYAPVIPSVMFFGAHAPMTTASLSPTLPMPTSQEEPVRMMWDAGDDSDHDGRRRRGKQAEKAEVGGSTMKFACPYFQRNPKKYRKWTSCPGPGWEEVHRVKYEFPFRLDSLGRRALVV
jgi:hypothetical protein